MNKSKGCNIFLMTVCICAVLATIIFLPIILGVKIFDIFEKKNLKIYGQF
ncbi:MAG: hypothetical protein LUD77_06725 [Clostridiales bacterium]|nr:hypothetical protein [Clostridiales bacterium]